MLTIEFSIEIVYFMRISSYFLPSSIMIEGGDGEGEFNSPNTLHFTSILDQTEVVLGSNLHLEQISW